MLYRIRSHLILVQGGTANRSQGIPVTVNRGESKRAVKMFTEVPSETLKTHRI